MFLGEIDVVIGAFFFGRDKKRDFFVDVEEGLDVFRWGRSTGVRDEVWNSPRVRDEFGELHVGVAAGALQGEGAEDAGQEGGPAGRERCFRGSYVLGLGVQAEESSGGGGIEAGVAAVVLVSIRDVDGEASEEVERREAEGFSFSGTEPNGWGVGEVGQLRERDGRAERIGETSGELVSIGDGKGIGVMNVKTGVRPRHHIGGGVVREDADLV